MENIEDNVYKVRLENDKTTLFHGNIWECEKWIRMNGKVDTTYCIVKLKRKETEE